MTKNTRQQHNKRKNKRQQNRKLELNAANIIANETPEESSMRLKKEIEESIKLEEMRENFIKWFNNSKINSDPTFKALCEWDSCIADEALKAVKKYIP
jgi:hypothetical protein